MSTLGNSSSDDDIQENDDSQNDGMSFVAYN